MAGKCAAVAKFEDEQVMPEMSEVAQATVPSELLKTSMSQLPNISHSVQKRKRKSIPDDDVVPSCSMDSVSMPRAAKRMRIMNIPDTISEETPEECAEGC